MKETVHIHTEYIQLDQVLKLVGLIQTGGQIKPLLEEGQITINGEVATAKRKKIYPGDVIHVEDVEITVLSEA